MLEIVFLLIGILIGAAAVWFFMRGKAASSGVLEAELRSQINSRDEELAKLRSSLTFIASGREGPAGSGLQRHCM